METNINISTITKYFSQNKEKNTSNIRSKIVNHSYASINEVNISAKIKQIPYYSNFFSILNDYEGLNIAELSENIIEKLKNIDNIKYYIFYYSDNNSIDFIDFLYNSKSIKKLIFDMINSFQHIFCGLNLLNKNNLCYFNISPKNIVYLENFREKPVLNNFMLCLNLNNLNYNYFSNIIHILQDFTYQPLEIHILFYLVKHDISTISYSFIEEFSENFVNNLNILRLFSEDYKKSYKEQCIEIIRKYINWSKNDIIYNIIQKSNKWDVYGISMLYLQVFGCISRIFSLKGTFISKITLELSKNLHPDSDKRMSLKETLNIFNKLLNKQHDWKFIDKLDNSKLNDLFNEFAK